MALKISRIASKKNSSSHKSLVFLIEIQECQNLIEENRRLQSKHPTKMTPLQYGSLQYECSSSVENVVLHTKIETLQWQLRQVWVDEIADVESV